MDKFVGKWKMLRQNSPSVKELQKENTCTIRRLNNEMMMIQSEWETQDNKSGFLGYTVYTDGVPREVSGSDLKYVTRLKDNRVLTTSKMEANQVKAMEIREVLDSGELKVTTIEIGPSGEQIRNIIYYQKVDSVG